jgi:hypothetical protein
VLMAAVYGVRLVPSTSKKQHNLMEAVAHNPSFAKKVGIKQSVGKEFASADKGKTFKRGGLMATKQKFPMGEAMGKVKTAAPSRDGIAEKGKTKGKEIKMAGASKGMKKGGKC